jgi:hypothetical protein
MITSGSYIKFIGWGGMYREQVSPTRVATLLVCSLFFGLTKQLGSCCLIHRAMTFEFWQDGFVRRLFLKGPRFRLTLLDTFQRRYRLLFSKKLELGITMLGFVSGVFKDYDNYEFKKRAAVSRGSWNGNYMGILWAANINNDSHYFSKRIKLVESDSLLRKQFYQIKNLPRWEELFNDGFPPQKGPFRKHWNIGLPAIVLLYTTTFHCS